MRLKEYQGKEIFREYGIPVPKSWVISSLSPEVLDEIAKSKQKQFVVKAQVLSGKRNRIGGIITADSKDRIQEAYDTMAKNRALQGFREVLVETRLDIAKELYLAVTIDRFNKNYVLVYSETGGMDIEDRARKDPGAIRKANFFELDKTVLAIIKENKIKEIALKLWSIVKEKNALLAEINPLVLTAEGEYVAADSKIVIDENAANSKTKKDRISYVELGGDIGIIGNGAGLVMATVDAVKQFGGEPACFLDLGGGAGAETMQKAIKTALSKKPRALFINIFAGITRCDEIAKGIANYKKGNDVRIPVIVRMAGTNEREGGELLKKEGIIVVKDMEEGVRKAVER